MSNINSQYKKLHELGFVGRGKSKHRPRNDPSLYGGNYPFIQTGDVKRANFYISEYTQTYNETGLVQSKLWNKGTLCITIAANIAENGILAIDACFPDSVIGFIPDKEKSDVRFVKYCLDTYKLQMQSISQGATQDNLSLDKLDSINFLVPPLKTQQQIADILTAYDDLIETNNQRIATLEAIAQQIYKEWFVRLRFPNWEHTPFHHGIPDGWAFGIASDFFTVVKGKSYKGDELTENKESMLFITLKSFNRGGGYREDGLKYYSGRYNKEQVVYKTDVVMAVTDMTQDRVVVGRVARVPDFGDKGAVISLDVIKLVPHSITKSFLYSYMRHSGFGDYIKEFANGANVLHLKPDLVAKQKVMIPPNLLQEKFSDLVEPIYEQMDALSAMNENAVLTRNLLLPRLISGKLTLKQATQQITSL
jgi:type I restriction enzyme, S subunit